MEFIDVPAIGFRGMAIGFDAGKRWDKGSAAPPAVIALGMDFERDLPAKTVEVTYRTHVRSLAVDLQAPGLATLVSGAFRSTARAGRPGWLLKTKMKDRVKTMLLDFLHPIPCNSDFLYLF